MRQLYQDGGPFGPMPRNRGNARFTQAANPGVYRNFRQQVGAQLTAPNGQLAVSATNAGKTGIGCCSECSATNRQGS